MKRNWTLNRSPAIFERGGNISVAVLVVVQTKITGSKPRAMAEKKKDVSAPDDIGLLIKSRFCRLATDDWQFPNKMHQRPILPRRTVPLRL